MLLLFLLVYSLAFIQFHFIPFKQRIKKRKFE